MSIPVAFETVGQGDICVLLCCCSNWPLVQVEVISNGHEPLINSKILKNFGNEDYEVGKTFKFPRGQRVVEVQKCD